MKTNAKEVIDYVSGKMAISPDDAQKALCITDREMVIELESIEDKGRFDHVIEHDLDTGKVDLKKIAAALDLQADQLSTYVEDDMIWIVCGRNIVEGIVGEGPNAKLATASFYRQWYKEKVINQ